MEMWNGFRSCLGLEGLTAVGERKGRRGVWCWELLGHWLAGGLGALLASWYL